MYERGLMMKVSELFYYKRLPQKTIAERLGISAATVSRILNEAFFTGLIKVEIVDVDRKMADLEARLKEKFGLLDSVIVASPSSPNPDFQKKVLGKAACEYVFSSVRSGMRVGLGPGSTMFEFVEALDPKKQIPGITLLPLMGGWGVSGLAYEVNRLLSTAASLLRCEFYLMPCPALLSSDEVRSILLKEPLIEEILKLWEAVDIAVFSLGSEVESGNYPQLRKNEGLLPLAKKSGAVGDVLGRFIDKDGKVLDIDVNRRIVSLPVPDLLRVPVRVGIGGGTTKIRVLRAGMKSGLINVLVSDATTCETILEMEDSCDE